MVINIGFKTGQFLLGLVCVLLLPVGKSLATGMPTALTPPIHPMQVTVIGSRSDNDERHAYEIELIHMLLDKTINEFGAYEASAAPKMAHKRGLQSLSDNTYTNFVRTFGYSDDFVENRNLQPLYYPVYRGLLGYRTCFVSATVKEKFAAVKTRLELLQFTHVYGEGWADSLIIKQGGIPVLTSSSYHGMFRMVAEDRVDLFCRGTNEAKLEYNNNKQIPGLAYDRSKAFYYPFPHFFFTNKSNTKLIARLKRGFDLVLEDGSWLALWHKHFDDAIDFVELEKRQIFYFENPLINHLDKSYEQYLYLPENFDKSRLSTQP